MATTMLSFDFSAFKAAALVFPRILFDEMKPAAEKASRSIVKNMVVNRLSGPRPDRLGVRTGMLRRSAFNVTFGDRIGNLGYTVGFDTDKAPYAPMHEPPPDETEIRAKEKLLAVPLPDALTPAGVLRNEYNPGKGGSLRSIPGLRLVKYPSGALILVKKEKGRSVRKRGFGIGTRSSGGEKHLFILKHSVKFKRKLGFMDTWDQSHAPGGESLVYLNQGFMKAVARWNRGEH